MTRSPQHNGEMMELIHAACDGRLSVEDRARLDAALASDADLRWKYVRLRHINAAMRWQQAEQRARAATPGELPVHVRTVPPVPTQAGRAVGKQ